MGLEVHYVGEALFPGGPSAYSGYNYKTRPADWTEAFLQLLDPSAMSSFFLEPNMVLTVEPGIYFNRYAMEEVYLKMPFAKYINKPLLEKYYSIGGVRIEDDILVTKDGYENLTTTPKGDAALKIINEWKGKEASLW